MYRNFDNWDVYIDNDRKILAGCVQFMLKDGTTSANIYDSDKVPIENPQITDINGRTEQQVFVDDDIRAYFYKYVGQGSIANERQNGIDTSDQSKWSLQYTVESASIDERSIAGTTAMGVNTIEDLRNLDPDQVPEIDGVKVVTLNGYYEAGDKEPINYIWDSNSLLNDDNGSVIQCVALTGRWIMVQPTEHCDSRHFGIFPQDSSDAEIDHSTRITQLLSYCNTKSIHPYFNGSVSYPYFIYNSVAYNSRNAVDVSNDTVFVDKGTNNRFFGEWNGNPYFFNANTTVNSTTVRHSWHFRNYATGTVKYIVDDDWSPVILSNIEVELEVSPAGSSQLTDCELVSNEKITRSIVLNNMTIHTDWFADSYNWSDLQMSQCNVILQNCKDANTYIILKNKLNEADYGDLGEQTVSGLTLLANSIAENAAFSNVTLTGNTELHNVSGTITVSGAAYQLNFVDCWLSLTNTSNVVLSDIMWRRGAINCTARIQPLTTLYLEGVEVRAPFYTIGIEPQYINCAIHNRQNIFRQVKMVDCRIHTEIYQYPELWTSPRNEEGYFWCGEFFGNTFVGDSAKIVLAPVDGVDYSSLYLGLYGKVCNNLSDHNFIDDSLWNGVSKAGFADNSGFRYQGNTGGCPVFEDEITYTMPYTYLPYFDRDTYYCSNVPGTTDSTGCWVVRDGRSPGDQIDIAYDVYWILNFKNVPLPVNNLFRLPYLRGNQTLLVKAFVQVFLRPDGNSDWPFYMNEFTVDTPMLNTNVVGNTNVAYASSFRPMKYHYAGIRYCAHDDVDDWQSSLAVALNFYNDAPASFTGSVKYRYHFDDFGKTTPVG